jgi:hypothetical protein
MTGARREDESIWRWFDVRPDSTVDDLVRYIEDKFPVLADQMRALEARRPSLLRDGAAQTEFLDSLERTIYGGALEGVARAYGGEHELKILRIERLVFQLARRLSVDRLKPLHWVLWDCAKKADLALRADRLTVVTAVIELTFFPAARGLVH